MVQRLGIQTLNLSFLNVEHLKVQSFRRHPIFKVKKKIGFWRLQVLSRWAPNCRETAYVIMQEVHVILRQEMEATLFASSTSTLV